MIMYMYNQFSKTKKKSCRPNVSFLLPTRPHHWMTSVTGHPYTNLGLVLKVAGPKNSSIIALPCSDFIRIKQVQMHFQFSCRFVF